MVAWGVLMETGIQGRENTARAGTHCPRRPHDGPRKKRALAGWDAAGLPGRPQREDGQCVRGTYSAWRPPACKEGDTAGAGGCAWQREKGRGRVRKCSSSQGGGCGRVSGKGHQEEWGSGDFSGESRVGQGVSAEKTEM